MNQCHFDSLFSNGFPLDSVQLIISPSNGTLDSAFTYCPDSNFVGRDTVLIYGCYMGSCDTFAIVFVVQPNCGLSVTLLPDTLICIGGNRSFVAEYSGGA